MRTSAALSAAACLLVVAACEQAPSRSPFADLLAGTSGRFLHASSTDTTGGNHDYLEIAKGDSAVLLDLAGSGEVRRLWITVASPDRDYLRRIALKMYWDGETNPSVEAPLGDFFGDGFAKKHWTSLLLGESSGGFYCYFPMPFRRHARIVVENGTGKPIDAFYYNIDLVTGLNLPRDVATFHAWWHRDPRTTAKAPHLILDAHGRGWFVGTSYNVQSAAKNLSFLEGDEIFTVDGEKRGQGTGTEDYFNSGWYFDEGPYAGPFHGLIIKNDTLGRIAAYRFHIADRVPFYRSIKIEIEHGTENTEVADYATMGYWYQTEPHTPLPPLPAPDDRRVPAVIIPPDATMLDSAHAPTRGGATMVALDVPRPDRYTVVVYPVGGPDSARTTFSIAGGAAREVRLAANDPGTLIAPVSLGDVAGRDSLRIAIRGRHLPAAVEARPLRRWAMEWNVVGPFASPKVSGKEISPALDTVLGPEKNPDLAASYGGVGRAPLRWRRVTAAADGRVYLTRIYRPSDWVLAYGEAFVYSPARRHVQLLLGADDGHVMWVNSAKVSERQGRHTSEPDDVAVPVDLKRGWNRVLLKVANLDGGWAFQLRAADPDGVLRWAARPGR